MSDYPEHDKMSAVKAESQAIGEFLDFCGFTLCRVVPAGNTGVPKYVDKDGGNPSDVGGMGREWNPAYESWNEHFAPVGGSIERILADYFEIDLDVIEREKRAMLDALRTAAT